MTTVPTSLLTALGLFCGTIAGWPALERTQTLRLRAGWNAVFLEVQPAASTPLEVFGKLPVETVACFVPGRIEARYLRDPGDAPWRGDGWAVWYAPSKPEAFLSNLYEVQAQRAFMVLASADFTWNLVGEARATVLEWHPDTCTFTGLPVDPTSPPTFAQFFAGSDAHRRMRIFRLAGGVWKLVSDPSLEQVQSGEAYWIQTDGASSYQGPLRVTLPANGDLDFDLRGGEFKLDFLNASKTSTARVTVELASAHNTLPLHQISRDLSKRQTTRTLIQQRIELPLRIGATGSLRVGPDRDSMQGSSGTTLLRITDGRGTLVWVPVRAQRDAARPRFDQP